MKNISLMFLTMMLIFTSCSKEAKLTRDLKGKWVVVSISNYTIIQNTGFMEFDKKNLTLTGFGGTSEPPIKGTYILDSDVFLKYSYFDNNVQMNDVMTVNSYSKTKLSLTWGIETYGLEKVK